MDWINDAGLWWLIAAVALAVTELMVPGVFLIFLAVAAAITGAITLFFPELSIGGQLIGFAAWSAVTVAIGKRWYRDYPVETSDPMLNDRVARLIGQTVTVVTPIEGGQGRVRVGDGEWSALGADAPAGTHVKIVGTRDGSLLVEPMEMLGSE
ncbi:NfeD family protein [Stakelama tenebrarum]|uniref:NfeD family protein n=1 Tax=Stakelama tenebrarum TaxID=2711215 RepID=A0A6G6Y6K2_9SPHN|nr:NfeD family protein [Sphingosinithalassobacter tenebrarum]QIG80562.1 NfeD family protein [Sphingosinithalassobacter tenebrarum]